MDEVLLNLRSRSRSKTPFLRSSCNHESCTQQENDNNEICHHRKSPILNKKHKQIVTIFEEETDTNRPKTPSKRKPMQSITSSTTTISSKRTTSDYSSNSSEDLSPKTDATPTTSESTVQIVLTNQNQNIKKTLKSDFITKSKIIKSGVNNGRPPIYQGGSKTKEILQNESNTEFEENCKIKTSTPILEYNQKHLKKSSKFNEGNFQDLRDLNSRSYKEYINAGEYWKKYPKTDYTYSNLSPHRRELAPGVIAFPNMSRTSLEKYNERVNYMIQRNPQQAETIRKRFLQSIFSKNQQSEQEQEQYKINQLMYDSQDEIDFHKEDKNNIPKNSLITRFIPSIFSIFHVFTSYFTLHYNKKRTLNRSNIHGNHEGFYAKCKNSLVRLVYSFFKTIYLMVSSILYFDTWLLRSSNADGKKKKIFLLFLLILLPFLLLTACKCLNEEEKSLLSLRMHNLIPFSLIGLQKTLNNVKLDISTFNFKFGGPSLPDQLIEDKSRSTSKVNVQNLFNNEDYINLVNQLNIYIEKTIDNRINQGLKKNPVSQEIKYLIANLAKENFQSNEINFNKAFKDMQSNVKEKIIGELQKNLETSKFLGSNVLNKDNINQIKKIIRQTINDGSHAFEIIQKINFDELLSKILNSPKLLDLIDSKLTEIKSANVKIREKIETDFLFSNKERDVTTKHQQLIDELNAKISFIRENLANHFEENSKLHYSISLLQSLQSQLKEKLISNEININGRFNNLVEDIGRRLVNVNDKRVELINKQIKLNLIDILGYSTQNGEQINLDELDIKNWIQNVCVVKAALERRLIELSLKIDGNVKDEIEQSGQKLLKDISKKIKIEVLEVVQSRQKDSKSGIIHFSGTELNELEIRRIIQNVLTIYDADKTGMVDYALESAGGQVLSTRCTENYQIKSAQISLFGLPLWYPSNTPRIAISPSVQPGECWAFQGFPGFLGFSLEHIPKSLAPSGNIDSAPKNFTVWGLDRENDDDPVLFGEYEYSDSGSPLQYFKVENKNIVRSFEIIELKIETNHGNLAYTCLYRFRVHGKLLKTRLH